MCTQFSIWREGSNFTNFNKQQQRINMKKDQQLKIKKYLENPQNHPRPQEDNQRHFVYLLAYLGELFIQGYRIIEQFDNILILSLMEFQTSQELNAPEKRMSQKLPSKYKGVLWQYDESNINDSAAFRRTIFSKMLQVSLFFTEIEYNIIYLHHARYSVLSKPQLERAIIPSCKDYYKKIQWIQKKNGFKPLPEKDQGIEMHKLAQHYIKGAGQARNLEIIRRMQNKSKFSYDLFYAIHSICYVVGKQMLENDYQTISSQKWMRFTTEKRFKRYDLLLRNESKCGIIDWKFSKIDAQQKIKGNGVKNKNKLYYQLAYKDFLTDVQLKFYCFHTRIHLMNYHYYTCASYFHKIPIEYIDKMEEIINIEDDQSSQEQNHPEQSIKNGKEIEEIEVKSSSLQVDLERFKQNEDNVINLDGEEIESKSTQKENKSLSKKREGKSPQIMEPAAQVRQKNGLTKSDGPLAEMVVQHEEQMNIFQEKQSSHKNSSRNMKKSQIKQAKFKQKFIDLTSDNNEDDIAIDVIAID